MEFPKVFVGILPRTHRPFARLIEDEADLESVTWLDASYSPDEQLEAMVDGLPWCRLLGGAAFDADGKVKADWHMYSDEAREMAEKAWASGQDFIRALKPVDLDALEAASA